MNKKKYALIMYLELIQAIIILTAVLYKFFANSLNNEILFWGIESQVLHNCIFFTLILSLFIPICMSIFITYTLYTDNYEQQMKKTYDDSIIELVNTIKAQRHDHMNHLHTIYSLSKMGEFNSIHEYISGIVEEVNELYELATIKPHAVGALIKAKYSVCENKGIKMQIDIKSRTSEISNIKPWDLCKIVGNLIDNAIDAVDTLPEKEISIVIDQSYGVFYMEIKNKGILPNGIDLFAPGSSTKNNRKRGFGLYITKSLVKKYKGTIDMNTNEESFVKTVVTLPITTIEESNERVLS
ncbi:MAG: GHKL domain-containing protein [Clostridia bacterium]|nr:GHKL domain-containing protein [Clostridia bacterium]